MRRVIIFLRFFASVLVLIAFIFITGESNMSFGKDLLVRFGILGGASIVAYIIIRIARVLERKSGWFFNDRFWDGE